MSLVERDPKTTLKVDLKAGYVPGAWIDGLRVDSGPRARHADDRRVDTTGLLLDRYEDVNAVSSRLPYLSGFLSSSMMPRNARAACDRSPPLRKTIRT